MAYFIANQFIISAKWGKPVNTNIDENRLGQTVYRGLITGDTLAW